jgi:AcrR family transcriptional regulator
MRMGNLERKQKEQAIRRTDIIDAAERVIFSKGYLAATMDDIAREAEFSKRTVYVYFNSKEQIYFEIMVRGYRLMLAALRQTLAAAGTVSAADQVRVMAESMYQFSLTQANYFNAIMEYETGERDFQNGVPDAARQECYALGEETLGLLLSALQGGVQSGELPAELDVHQTGLLLWANLVGVFTLANKKSAYLRNFHHTEPENLVQVSIDFCLKAIACSIN